MVSSAVSSFLESDLVEFCFWTWCWEADQVIIIKVLCIWPVTYLDGKAVSACAVDIYHQHCEPLLIDVYCAQPSLGPNVLKNFWPVANLPFISKVVEKAIALQISTHLEKNGLNDMYQSAYKKCHSMETTLLCVQDDLLMALDSGSC